MTFRAAAPIAAAVGIALMVMLDRKEPAYLAGLIPLLVGAALLAYSYLLAPRE